MPLRPGGPMPDRFQVTLAAMRTEAWLLYGAWGVAGLVLAMLGHWQIGLITSLAGAAADILFQRRLKILSRAAPMAPEAGIARLTPIVAIRFSLGVAGALIIIITDHGPATMAAVMMLQAWSICVALAQFCAVPRLFYVAITPPLVTVAVSMWPYLSGPSGPALLLSLSLLVLMLAVIGRQVGKVWEAWSASWAQNASLIEDLKDARRAADAASQAKSTFLATMSHEVRTPLNGILGMSQVMALHPLDPDQRERVKVIQRSGEALLGTLNAVLDLSRIEAGRLELVEGHIEPAVLIADSVQAFEAAADLKGVRLSARCEDSADGVFRGDPIRVRQIVDNLVGNAVKFTETGRIDVHAGIEAHQLVITVTDTGCGVGERDLERIFSPFEQAEGAALTHKQGSGLGLSIARDFAALMGGSLGAESQPGQGSVFRLTLPAMPTQAPGKATPVAPPDKPASFAVLVAEDNPTNRLVISSLLQHLGAEVEMVENGRQAIERLMTREFDFVLMDVQMPVMDGLSATRAIRNGEAGPTAKEAVIIGVTGNAMTHQQAECLAAGMSAVVPKPIELSTLVQTLNALAPAPADRP
ncbi:ATP-binding protein [Brevundimonas sp.]|uniref:ATP-binding protein n=1 Tax=Brevundimonas sp. TaxID=1871086 RepID=UPI0039195C65